MKYVSPQTEKRKQQQKKRKKQLALCVCIAAVAVALFVAVFALMGRDEKPQSSSQPDSEFVQNSQEQQPSSDTQNNSSSDEQISSEENKVDSEQSSQEEQTPQSATKPKKKKKSIFARIGSIFSKEEVVEVVFPAMSFGVQVSQAAESIISLSPMATEIILSSPSQHSLVAVSEYCNKRGTELMTVGTPLIPKTDKIIQLAPDYLIVQNPLSEQDKIKIQQSGITVLQFNAPQSLEDFKEIYRSVTALTKGADIATLQAERVYADLTEKLGLYDVALANVQKKSAVMLFNSYGMVATKDTFEGKILSTFFDIAVDGQNYFAQSVEEIAQTNPQVLIVSDLISAEQLAQLGFGETEAYKNGNVYYVNIQNFENASAKSLKTLAGIANSVYGDAIQPAPAEETEDK
ncbi:MAG: ABC transporter substrate-binding protein [Oscillospiraceae bacterium]|nr:ABC transporter substrate-binding protein [Oscillospiraceae bacterium]